MTQQQLDLALKKHIERKMVPNLKPQIFERHQLKGLCCLQTELPSYLHVSNTCCNRWRSICRLLHVLARFLFTTSEQELGYYHQMHELPHDLSNDLSPRILRNQEISRKSVKSSEFMIRLLPIIQKPNFARKFLKICCKIFQSKNCFT